MEHLDLIIKIAAVITALGVIVGFIVKFFKRLNDFMKKLDEFKDSIETLQTHSEDNYMSILRLVIISNDMPIGERIKAGYKYLENDGNGDIQAFLKEKFNITKTVDEAPHYKK